MNGNGDLGGPPRWVWRILTISVVATLLVTGWFVIRNSGHAAHITDDVKTLVLQGRQASARADCRSAISAKFTEKRDTRDNLSAQTFTVLLTVVFTHVPQGSPLTDAENEIIRNQNQKLSDAQAAVDALPRLDQAVDHGYDLDGHHFPPCPKVGG